MGHCPCEDRRFWRDLGAGAQQAAPGLTAAAEGPQGSAWAAEQAAGCKSGVHGLCPGSGCDFWLSSTRLCPLVMSPLSRGVWLGVMRCGGCWCSPPRPAASCMSCHSCHISDSEIAGSFLSGQGHTMLNREGLWHAGTSSPGMVTRQHGLASCCLLTAQATSNPVVLCTCLCPLPQPACLQLGTAAMLGGHNHSEEGCGCPMDNPHSMSQSTGKL